ncbi:A disintegrin and metalloproteinase with thrombospondin motifs 7, partial [Dufourea novaeangliae]
MAKTIAKRAFSSQKAHPTKNQDKSYTLELLLVLDKTVLDYHKALDIENYVLTLLNMVAGLLHDTSLGVPMELSVVRIIRMQVQDDEMNLSWTKDANRTLQYFQEWQRIINPGDDSHPNHHDLAILLEKTSICVTPNLCGFTGASTTAGTCDPLKSAAVVMDAGLQTGYQIAHQIGHTKGLGFCLEDKPQDHDLTTAELLPGVMYSGDDQCRMLYRPDARQCNLGIWCYGSKCLMVGERPGVVDGGWSSWSPWSRCSRSCGSGVAFSFRRCTNPLPSNGGSYCRGDRKRHKICASNPCDVDAPSFLDVQCGEFNRWIYPEDGNVHRWTAYNLPENLRASENPCALYCLSETNIVASLRPKVVDGTTCYTSIRSICIGGVCTEIPCDLNMESSAVEDVCGVCRGNGTSCSLKEDTVTIESASRMFDVAGSKAWLGTIRPSQEALNIPGPVMADLLILILPKENVTVKYSLGLKEKSTRKPEFSWGFVDWEKCSANCGPGEQISKPRCLEKVAGLVDETFCKSIARPQAKVRPCHQAPCLPRWMIGEWQDCTPCVPGCEKRRAVKCVRPVGYAEQDVDVIADSYCQGPKPKEQESCTGRRRRDD